MAARSGTTCGFPFPIYGGIGILDHTHVEVHEVGCSLFAPVRPFLSVWPSTRPKWPPPRVSRAGVLRRRMFALESAAGGICQEGGGRVKTNLLMREMDGVPNVEDVKRLEVVVDGLPLFEDRQIVINTTLVGAVHCDGSPRRGAAYRDGVALTAFRKRKKDRHPELVGPRCRTRLVVQTSSFLSQLAAARARQEIPLLPKRAEQAWRLPPGCDGISPSTLIWGQCELAL